MLAAAIALVGGMFAWRYYYNPEQIVNAAVAKMGEASEQEFAATFHFTNNEQTRALLGESGQVELTVNGVYKHEADNQPADVHSDILLTAKTDSVSLQLAAKVRLVGDKIYIYIEKAPPMFPALAQLRGQWVELPRTVQMTNPLTAATEELLQNITYKGKEVVANHTTYRYQAVATQTAVVRTIDTIVRLMGSQLTEEHISQLKDSMQDMQQLSVDLWIRPLTRQVQQIRTTWTTSTGNGTDITIVLNTPKQELTIERPADVVTIESLAPQPSTPTLPPPASSLPASSTTPAPNAP